MKRSKQKKSKQILLLLGTVISMLSILFIRGKVNHEMHLFAKTVNSSNIEQTSTTSSTTMTRETASKQATTSESVTTSGELSSSTTESSSSNKESSSMISETADYETTETTQESSTETTTADSAISTDSMESQTAPSLDGSSSEESKTTEISSDMTAGKSDATTETTNSPTESKSSSTMNTQPTETMNDQGEFESEPPLVRAPKEEIEDNYYFSVVKNLTTAEFIAELNEDAREVAWENDLYASVMIAQAILETGSGNSALSSSPNYNLFGIKGSYEGKSVVMKTSEDAGDGLLYTIHSAFRKYPSYRESLEDYAALLREGVSGNAHFYRNTWKSNSKSYQDVTAFLTGRYATDIYYGKKLNALITTYQLTQYDEAPSKVGRNKRKGKGNYSQTARGKGKDKKKGLQEEQAKKKGITDLLVGNRLQEEKFNDGLGGETIDPSEEQVSLLQRKVQDVPGETKICLKTD